MRSRVWALDRMRRRGGVAAAVGGLALAALVGCSTSATTTGSSASPPGGTPAAGASSNVTGNVTVFAAASLTTAFNQVETAFHAANPGATATFNYGGSATLATQIDQGAPADVFAAANTTAMQPVVAQGSTDGQPTIFAKNQLQIAVAPGNPKHIATLADLTAHGLKLALCEAAQPCGSAAATVEKNTGITLSPVTLTPDVTSALTDVELGEVDAALVYRTDVLSADGKVTGVDFPESSQAINSYPIVVVAHAPHASAAQAFVQFVLSPQGQAILQRNGFQAP